jgi:hypothetical protein
MRGEKMGGWRKKRVKIYYPSEIWGLQNVKPKIAVVDSEVERLLAA